MKRNIESKQIKKATKLFQGSIIPILIGTLISLTINITVGTFISAIGFVLMAILNSKYGNYVLQGEILKHIVIMSTDGIPVYGY